jgi:hypothetical protein
MENYFSKLAGISVREKIERKGNLDYLSWANAWSMLKQVHPDAQRVIYESEHTGMNYFTDGKTCYVKVGVIVNGIEHIDYLPVMDFRNNAIPYERVTSMDVNKTIQRSTAKAIAMHGLGLSLWTGEDIPETPTASAPKQEELVELTKDGPNWTKVSAYIISNRDQVSFADMIQQLSRKYTISAAIKKELQKMATVA